MPSVPTESAYDICGLVEEVIEYHLRTTYDDSRRSVAGRMVIDAGRLKLRGPQARCLICGKPKKNPKYHGDGSHRFISSSTPGPRRQVFGDMGYVLRAVASGRDISPFMRVRVSRESSRPMESPKALRKLSVAVWLGKIEPDLQDLVVEAARLRKTRADKRRELRRVEYSLGSATRRQKLGPEGCAEYARRRAELREESAAISLRYKAIVCGKDADKYNAGILHLAMALVPGLREELFGEAA